jgi:hypothetical protein
MHHITDAIFSFLDFEDLRRAASASTVWRKAITEGNLWKKLLDRNVSFSHFTIVKNIN